LRPRRNTELRRARTRRSSRRRRPLKRLLASRPRSSGALANSSVGWQLEPTVSYPIGIVTLALTGDIGTLLAADAHPGVASLPFGFGVGAYAAFALAPTSTIALGCYAGQPDVSVSAGALRFYVNYRWSF